MGEKIKIVSQYSSDNLNFEVELNKASIVGGSRYIHLQSHKGRLCITESEYLQLVSTINKARKNLENNKNIGLSDDI